MNSFAISEVVPALPAAQGGSILSRLLAFNLLPSISLHPSRQTHFGLAAEALPQAMPAAMRRAWHKHRSAQILTTLGLGDSVVSDLSTPALALAVLPPAALQRVAVYLGAMRYAPSLRTTIAGGAVRQLMALLDARVLDYVRQRPLCSLATGSAGPLAADACMATAGFAVLGAAFRQGGPSLARRAELKLPDGIGPGQPGLDAGAALGAANEVLMHLEPLWHSSFPPAR